MRLFAAFCFLLSTISASGQGTPSYLGFDRNNYPGEQNLKALRQTFAFAGYWLNRPPSASVNTWLGKRQKLEAAGFGFLVLFNGRLYAELKTVSRATALGRSDARVAVSTAHRDGFPGNTIIFLDQEQGGRMLPEQKAYIYAWVDGVNSLPDFVPESTARASPPKKITAPPSLRRTTFARTPAGRKIVYFVTDDACPPAPGCVFPSKPPIPAESGIDFADVWQFAQSPRRKDVSAGCPATHNRDGNCYPPEWM